MDQSHIIKAIKKCQKSADPKAFKILYDQFSEQVYGVCLRYLKGEADAQDILQETFIAAYYKIEAYQFNGPFGAWITRIAVNKSLQKLRKDKKDIIIVQNYDQPEVNTMNKSFHEIEYSEQTVDPGELLIQFMNQLPLGYKTILNLVIIEGYSHKEVGEILEITESTSRSQLTRAKVALKKLVDEKELKTMLYD